MDSLRIVASLNDGVSCTRQDKIFSHSVSSSSRVQAKGQKKSFSSLRSTFLGGTEFASLSLTHSSPAMKAAKYSTDAASAAYVNSSDKFPNSTKPLPTLKEGFGGGLLTIVGDSLEQESESEYESDDDEIESFEDEFLESSFGVTGEGSSELEDEDPLAVVNLKLAQQLEDALVKRGITRLFPIQEAVMKPAMAGKDVIARAKTGTGKTLAFGIPILHKITLQNVELGKNRSRGGPRCIVLAPTRELANQVNRELTESAPHLTTLCVYGGVPIDGQIRQLRRGVDIVVGTPGRITDLTDRGSLDFSSIQFVVLDEADQMLAVGFEEDVERIMQLMPENRQTQLFSATMPSWVNRISKKYLNSPVTIDLVGEGDDKMSEMIRVLCVRAPNNSKRNILGDLITVYGKAGKSIVFTQTKRDADDVSVGLSRTVGCQALHGDIPQALREKTLQSFRDGKFGVLVATDVAARGLDIPNVDLVIHYEIPNDPETFVHRSGRTARAGKTGTAILMYTESQIRTLKRIERDVNSKFERISAPHVDDVLLASTQQAMASIEQVHPELSAFFLETAEKLLQEKGSNALASALAYMSGYTQPPQKRSLITYEEGWMTVRLVTKNRSLPMTSPRQVMIALKEMHPTAADNVGKIKIISDRNIEGAVFDLPERIAKELLSMKLQDSWGTLDCPKELPPLIEESDRFDRSRDNYGRFSSRDSRYKGGSNSGYRGGDSRSSGDRYGGDRSSSRSSGGGGYRGGRGGGYGDSRGDSRPGGYGDRPARGGSDRGDGRSAGSSAGRPLRTKEGENWEYGMAGEDSGYTPRPRFGGERSSRGGYGGGVCFLCNQPGHRAAECPQKGR